MGRGTYTNPVGGEIRMGDPFVLKHEGRYYLYGTAGGDRFNCWASADLVNWEPLGPARRHGEDSWGRGSFWAPEVVCYRDRFHMVYSCMRDSDEGFRICLAAADAPGGPFVDLHAPLFDIGWSCIDGHIFVDDDGTPYLFFDKVGVVIEPSEGEGPPVRYLYGIVYGARLRDDLSALDGEIVFCIQADQGWEDPQSTHVRCNEGAFVFKRGGRYYMTYSSGHYASPAYGIGCATAEAPLGPWTKAPHNPLAATVREICVSGPGHNSVTTSPDGTELFMVYHAHADPARPSGNRTVNIDRLTFDERGHLRLLGPTRTPQPMPSGAPQGQEEGGAATALDQPER